MDLREVKYSESYKGGKDGTTRFSPLWQADREKIQRAAPLDFVGRYMKGWWDYAVADELHQLAGDTAQGNGLGVLARCADKLIALTGTLMGGYADDLFNIFHRMEPWRMVAAISDQLPLYEETVLSVDMDPALAKAYELLERDITAAMKEHRGNKSLMSVMLNTLLLYPDHPFGISPIWGKQYDLQNAGWYRSSSPSLGNRLRLTATPRSGALSETSGRS